MGENTCLYIHEEDPKKGKIDDAEKRSMSRERRWNFRSRWRGGAFARHTGAQSWEEERRPSAGRQVVNCWDLIELPADGFSS